MKRFTKAVLAGTLAFGFAAVALVPIHAATANTASAHPDLARFADTSTHTPTSQQERVALAITKAFASRDPQAIRAAKRHTTPGSEAHGYIEMQALGAQVDVDAGVHIEQEASSIPGGARICFVQDQVCVRFTDWQLDQGRATTFQVDGSSIDGKTEFGNGESTADRNVEVQYLTSYESGRTNIIVRITNHRFGSIGTPNLSYKVDGRLVDSAYVVAPDRIERGSVLVRLCLDGSFDRGGTLQVGFPGIDANIQVPVPDSSATSLRSALPISPSPHRWRPSSRLIPRTLLS